MLFIGLSTITGIALLNLQERSVAEMHDRTSTYSSIKDEDQGTSFANDVPSQIGTEAASILATEQHVHEHPHGHSHEHAASHRRYNRRYSILTQQTRRQAAPKKRSAQFLPAIAAAEATDLHKSIANEVLMHLPEKCRETLQNFYVRYKKQKHRGLAGKHVMILDGTVPDKEFLALFVHETGHNFDLGCLKGKSTAKKSSFSDGDEAIYNDDPSVNFYNISWLTSTVQRSTARPEDFVSGYAAYAVFEDFAESFAYFYLHNDEFLKRAKNNTALARKYIWMRDVVFDGNIPRSASGNAPFTGRVPWDITKLDFKWHPEEVVAQSRL